jgi:hypothetical protein
MVSQRLAAQLGLLAATSVTVMCLGVLVSQGSNPHSQNAGASSSHAQVFGTVDAAASNSASLPMSLSALSQGRR